jgi:hypothetical protein
MVKYELIDGNAAMPILQRSLLEVESESERVTIAWYLSVLIRKGNAAALQFAAGPLELFVRLINEGSHPEDRDIFAELLLFVAFYAPGMDVELTKSLIRKVPFRHNCGGAKRTAPLLLTSLGSEGAPMSWRRYSLPL